MKFRAARDQFSDAVAWVARSLPSRPPLPVLGCVVLTAGESGLTISGFDYEVSATEKIAAEVADAGTVLVSGRLLADITKSLPNKPVDLTLDGSRVAISCGSAKFSLPTMPVEDYPELPELPQVTGTVPAGLFSEAISQVAVAAGKDDTLPMLTGIRVEIEGPKVVLAATDRFRLAVRELEWQPGEADVTGAVLVPARTLAESARTAAAGTGDVQLALGKPTALGGEGILGITTGNRKNTTRLLDADFPKFRQLFPAGHTSMAIISSAELIDAIKRVSLVAERGAQVRLEFSEGSVRLTAGGDEAGRAEEDLPVEFAGEPLTIAFNPGYLLDGLSAIGAERVEFGFTTPSRPAVLRPSSGEIPTADESGAFPAPESAFSYLLMPVRLPG